MLVDEVVKTSEQIPRAENQISRNEKLYLWAVDRDDE